MISFDKVGKRKQRKNMKSILAAESLSSENAVLLTASSFQSEENKINEVETYVREKRRKNKTRKDTYFFTHIQL